MFRWLRDLLTIYSWKEFWILMSVPTSVAGFWFLFCFLLAIPNDIVRAVAVWSLIFGLTFGVATVDALKKQQGRA